MGKDIIDRIASVLLNAFTMIAGSFVMTCVIFFFTNVIVGAGFDFFEIWKWTYVIAVIMVIGFNIVTLAIAMSYDRYVVLKTGVSIAEARKARHLGILPAPRVESLSAEDLRYLIKTMEAAEILAENVVNHLRGR